MPAFLDRTDAVLVLNAGASTIKYRIDRGGRAEESGLIERIGAGSARWVHRGPDGADVADHPVADHATGFALVLDRTRDHALAAAGHRVVHGGDRFTGPALVDDGVLAALEDLAAFAPLHNPAALCGVRLIRERRPTLPQVAVFDTAFHHRMPARARLYSLPRTVADRHRIRRYGFHGISHGLVARRAAEHLGRPLADLALVTVHLGNGASAAAVLGGRSIDTSMGLTPLSGLVMSTRAGDADPGVVFHMHRATGMRIDEIEDMLTRESGLAGLAGVADLRDLHRLVDAGVPEAAEALDLYCYRIRCCIGAYTAAMGRLDAIVFTGGVGEHDPIVRERVCAGLTVFGVRMDPVADDAGPPDSSRTISAPGSAVAVLVVPTDEEGEIARETRRLLQSTDPEGRS